MRKFLTAISLLAAGQAQAFCDEGILQTQVLCLTSEAEEIKLCHSVDPATEGDMLTLHLDPAVSEGPMSSFVHEIPFSMRPGTGGYPWDTYGLTFFHEGGRATLNLRKAIDAPDNTDVEISLSLFDRASEPYRTLTCMQPVLMAEVETLLSTRGIEMNSFRTGPSASSLAYFAPRQPLPGGTPYGGYSCREASLVTGNEGTDGGQVALYTAPFEGAAIMGYVYPSDLSGAFECSYENGFSAIVWPDADKRGDSDPWSMLDFEERLAACRLDAEGWPPNYPYLGDCSRAWVKEVNVAGFEE